MKTLTKTTAVEKLLLKSNYVNKTFTNEFLCPADCKDFYIKNIDDLEEMKTDLEEQLGDTIQNRNSLPHYTFICWLCFEEYCYDLYRTIYES